MLSKSVVLLSMISCMGCARVHTPLTDPTNYVSQQGHQIFRLEKGQGAALILLHGLPDHSLNQRRLIESLSETEHVFAYDRLGMGLSDKPQRSYRIPEQVEDLNLLLQQQEMQKPALLGHSIGGTIAIEYAAAHPEKTRALILMNPVLLFESGHTGLRDWNTWLMKQPVLGEMLMAFHSRFVTAAILERMFFNDQKVTQALIDSYHFPMQQKGAKKHFLGTLRSLYDLGTKHFLKSIESVKSSGIPVLIFWTKKDRDMPFADAVFLAERLQAKLFLIDDCGHLPQLELEDSRLVSEVIVPMQQFLADHKEP